jgi:hypothetical protein
MTTSNFSERPREGEDRGTVVALSTRTTEGVNR